MQATRHEAIGKMAHTHSRILFLGRNQSIANDLRTILGPDFSAQRNGNHPGGMGEQQGSGGEVAVRLEVVSSQKSAMPLAQELNPSLILIEASNKPESRLRFCQWLRERLPSAAIVAIGSTVLPYQFEFDGVLRTPIDGNEVVRLFARLRPARAVTVRRGAIELDPVTRIVRTPMGESDLTPKESALLQMLMERDGALVRRAEIINRIWETSYLDDTRTLDVHVRWLRRKIEPDPSEPVYLITRRGEGYLFRVPANEG